MKRIIRQRVLTKIIYFKLRSSREICLTKKVFILKRYIKYRAYWSVPDFVFNILTSKLALQKTRLRNIENYYSNKLRNKD